HALSVVNLEAGYLEALQRRLGFLFFDVDAINRAGASAFVAADTCRQIETMETPVARLHRYGQLGILVALGESPAAIGLQKIPQRHVHALADRFDRPDDVLEPFAHIELTGHRLTAEISGTTVVIIGDGR